MEPYSCLYLTVSLYLYIISVYMNVCILSDGASCTVTLQKHSHPWSSCNDPEVIFIPTWKGGASSQSIHKNPSSFLIPIIPTSSPTCPFIFHSPPTKNTPTYPLTTSTIPWFILSQVLAGGFDCIDGPGGSRRSCGSRSSSSVPGVHPGWWFHNYPWP